MQESTSLTIYRPKSSKAIPLTPMKSRDNPTGVFGGIALGLGAVFSVLGLILTFAVSPFFLIFPTVFPGGILAGVGTWIMKHKKSGQTDRLVLDHEGVRIHTSDKRIALNWNQINRVGLSPDGSQFQVQFKKNTYSVAFHRMNEVDKQFLERLIIDYDDRTNTEQF